MNNLISNWSKASYNYTLCDEATTKQQASFILTLDTLY